MLVKFTVSNFLSFKESTSIDLTATSLTEYRNDNLIQTQLNDLSLLKSLVIYGANSSGKSNLFKAIQFVRWFILNSSKDFQANEEINVEQFRLSTETIQKPSFFEIEFIDNATRYRYGFEVDKIKITKEWLYSQIKTKENLLFSRDYQEIKISKKFDLSSEKLLKITRENALFLSVCAQFNIEIAISILKVIREIKFLSGIDDTGSMDYTVKMMTNEKQNTFVNNFIKGANLGFNEVKIEKIAITEDLLNKSKIPKEIQKYILKSNEDNTVISTKHAVYDENNKIVGETYFDLMRDESLGTRKYFSLAGPIIDTLLNGKTLIIDEFDSRLHPVLIKAMIMLFNSAENNPYNAQLIFASHNSTFINASNKLFRRDQIVIVDKNVYGVTRMESLFDKKIRKDASFEKDYLSGKYEGIPLELKINSQLNLFE